MLIEVTVRYIEDAGRKESQTTRVYTVPPKDDWKVPLELWKHMGTVAKPLLEHGPVEVFEDGHEPWDRVLSGNKGSHWCARHEQWEVAT